MSEQVLFRATDAQVRGMIRLVVEASGYHDDGGPLASLEVVDGWRGKMLWWICYRADVPGTWTLVHGRPNHMTRPWAAKYRDASALCHAAGVEVLEERGWETQDVKAYKGRLRGRA